MNKVFTILLLLVAAAQLRAQQSATFKQAFLPATNYSVTKDLKMTLAMDSNSAVGAPGKTTMSMTSKLISGITTGKPDNSNSFPMKMDTRTTNVKIIVNGQELPGSAAVTLPTFSLYGKYLDTGKFMIDSASGMKMPDSIKNNMGRLVDAVSNYLIFPAHPLKIGDSFSQDVPLTLPAIPLAPTSGVNIRITYTLMRIAGNMASFEFTENINADPKKDTTTRATPINLTGTGSGSLEFDIKKHFFTTMSNSLTLNYELITGTATLKFSGTFISTDKAAVL